MISRLVYLILFFSLSLNYPYIKIKHFHPDLKLLNNIHINLYHLLHPHVILFFLFIYIHYSKKLKFRYIIHWVLSDLIYICIINIENVSSLVSIILMYSNSIILNILQQLIQVDHSKLVNYIIMFYHVHLLYFYSSLNNFAQDIIFLRNNYFIFDIHINHCCFCIGKNNLNSGGNSY